jgi:ferritin
MASQRFVDRLNEQVGHEFAAQQQYTAIAVYYDGLTMPQMAALFYRQAIEERDHAMMMVQYLLDTDSAVEIPGVEGPRNDFADIVEPVRVALEQEKRVTDQINALTAIAREEHDFASDQFMQWFIKEQVEEVSSMSSLLAIVERNRDDIENIEDYLRREAGAEGPDPSAPPVAGAGA